MSERVVTGLVPPSRKTAAHPSGPLRGDGRGLPVPAVATRQEPSAAYGIGRVDPSGRISARLILHTLGWHPGWRIALIVISDVLVLSPDPSGIHQLPETPHVVLPVAARTRCGIHVGDPVLLVADPDRDLLLIDTMTALEHALAPRHGALRGGETS
ncbi:AbrB/MazE/SpoVT family DNA-binding domain-containing protein [Saccharopolyspora pogona]|uniref:AbrB/MazE/SpoVT family DNA-binding domain-containing protein n=1 Tax=Saccharopolyspora pogona TaxID=333966 RepID=UPI001CC26DCC|nr:AbrB/MazE/SpoVT family DNA-binding domain-containing protein [Saccharopolyspora pogona]